MIAIIDYGMGNLRSVQKAFEFLGFKAEITDDSKKISSSDKVILPGVGAFEDAMKCLTKNKALNEAIYKTVEDDKPMLGICLGLQLLFDKSYENGEFEGLKLLEGEIVRFPDTVKVPHIGWNNLSFPKTSPLFEGLPENPYVYFVHSYHLKTASPIVTATTFYGNEIQVAVQKNNLFGVQFHPEKSGDIGLHILKNFGNL